MLTIPSKDKTGNFIDKLNTLIKNTQYRRRLIASACLLAACISVYFFVSHDESLYNGTIAKVTAVTDVKGTPLQDLYGNSEQVYTQQISAVIINGPHKGEKVQLSNKTTYSQVFDTRYKVNDRLFILVRDDAGKGIVSAGILDLKRDKYIAYAAIVFILLLIWGGGYKGLRSLVSILFNILISYLLIKLYIQHYNIILVASAASLLFIILSILIVSGMNRKSYTAIIGTMAATLFTMLMAILIIHVTGAKGIYYEEMDFLSIDPSRLFFIEILIGTLGGIMDIAISISSAIKELYDKNPGIDKKLLMRSGKEIGKDMMGTMSNILVFAYISGSIPIIMIWMKNGYSALTIINYHLSLEIVRALTGSIGIVISIPITLYVSVFLLGRRKIGVKP